MMKSKTDILPKLYAKISLKQQNDDFFIMIFFLI